MKVLVMSLALLAGGCLPKKETTKDTGEILVGAVFPMTGPIATYGQESINGIKMALAKINAEGIKGKKIRLIVEDNKGEPAESANAVRKLIDVDKVQVILGSVASSNTLAGAPIAQAARVPMVTPASTNETVTQKGDYIIRTCFTDAFQGVVMAKFALSGLGKKKAVVVVDVASDYSRGLADVFSKHFTKMGGQVLPGTFNYNQGDKDFRSLLNRIKRAAPEVVFVPGYYTEVALMLKQARQMDIKLPFLGGDGWDSPKLQELAGQGVLGNYISSHFSAQDTAPIVQEFVKRYKSDYQDQTPGAMAALGYDAMLVVADALMRVSGELSRQHIRDAIVRTRDFPGVTGSISIDENRNARKSAVVLSTTPGGMNFKQKVDP